MIYVLSAQVNETACISKSTATEHIETFEKSFKKFFFSVISVAKGLLQEAYCLVVNFTPDPVSSLYTCAGPAQPI